MELFIFVSSISALVSAAPKAYYGTEQEPKVWEALRLLRGGRDFTTEEIQNILKNAVPDKDYPIGPPHVPQLPFNCSRFKQPGYYADNSPESRCQIFHRCDENQLLTSFMCPNQTLFNQITLVCDWFFNVQDCAGSSAFVDYSNGRLTSSELRLLDDEFGRDGRVLLPNSESDFLESDESGSDSDTETTTATKF